MIIIPEEVQMGEVSSHKEVPVSASGQCALILYFLMLS